MSIVCRKNGILATFQDLGRFGFRKSGINSNGAMDRQAVRLINIILGNRENEAVLELHFPAPLLEFTENALIALGGADFGAVLGDDPVDSWRPLCAAKGSHLRFPKRNSGNRAYLAVKGGFQIDQWLGSASTNLIAGHGGYFGRCLEVGDEISFKEEFLKPHERFPYLVSSSMFNVSDRKNQTIRVIPGAEFDRLTAYSEQLFMLNQFTIARNSDRMGFRLNGEPLELFDSGELLSSAVDCGTIQLLPDGQMIILMADHQTTGGYPRIAHVVSCDQGPLGQLGADDKVRFEVISVAEAEDLILRNEAGLNYLRFACEQKTLTFGAGENKYD